MGQKTFTGSLNLTKLNHVRMKTKKGTEGIFIPIELNHLVEGKEKEGAKPVYLNIRVLAKDEQDQYGQNGFISQSVDSKIYKEATAEQKEDFKKLPILGNIKCWENDGDGATGNMGGNTTFDPDDDNLPF